MAQRMHTRVNLPERDSDGDLPSYAWPGGYPIYYVDSESSVLCPKCASVSSDSDIPQFRPVDYSVNYEDDSLYCDQCSQRIESAYAEDN